MRARSQSPSMKVSAPVTSSAYSPCCSMLSGRRGPPYSATAWLARRAQRAKTPRPGLGLGIGLGFTAGLGIGIGVGLRVRVRVRVRVKVRVRVRANPNPNP